MLPRSWLQLPCMDIAVNQLSIPRQLGVAGPVHAADIERRIQHRRLKARELIEDPDDEVRSDQRHVE